MWMCFNKKKELDIFMTVTQLDRRGRRKTKSPICDWLIKLTGL